MYQTIGEEIISSEEVAQKIVGNTPFHLKTDLTKATGREDAIGLRLSCKVTDIPTFEQQSAPDEEQINLAMEELDEFSHSEMKKIFFNCYAFMTFAYGYDEVNNEILFTFVLMDREKEKHKIKDVTNRLLRV
jgi:hypothetical protein